LLWAPILSATAVFVVGALGLYVAFRQWQTARTRVQLDLYDRRRPVYDAVVQFVGDVLTVGTPTYTRTIELAKDTQSATYIFGPEIGDYVRELERRADDTRAAEVKLQTTSAEPDRKVLIEEIVTGRAWFQSQFGRLDRLFRPYLQLEARNVRLWPARLYAPRTGPPPA
jgi:hypothetical protein